MMLREPLAATYRLLEPVPLLGGLLRRLRARLARFDTTRAASAAIENSTSRDAESAVPVLEVRVRSAAIRLCVANSVLRYFAQHLEEFEPETLDWIDTFQPGEVFYDVGASTGPYSLYAAIRSGSRVIAFEPESQNFAMLELNHYLNRTRVAQPIVSLNLALSDKRGLGKMYCERMLAGTHVKILERPRKVIGHQPFEPEHVQFVQSDRLDDIIGSLGLPTPAHLKIDVDGAETNVLQGAATTLSRPELQSVLIEIQEPEGDGAEQVALLKDAGLSLEQRYPVRRLPDGDTYPGVFNCLFRRSAAPGRA